MKFLLALLITVSAATVFSSETMAESEMVPLSTQAPAASEEESIPVNIGAVKKASTPESSMGRLVWVMGVMILVAGGAYFFARKYGRPGQSQQTQIKILTQYYVGPKKSLAIVRVAGESMLVGITDHSINLIKSLSLLDEEVPEATPAQFEKVMQDQDKVQQLSGEEFSIRHIKDVVSLKLKGMRNDL